MLGLTTLRPTHPRLLVTAGLGSLPEHIRTDPLLAAFVEQLRMESDAISAGPPVPFVTIPFAEFGFQMLEVSRAILARVTLHGFFYRLTGEARYAHRVRREVQTAVSYPTWNPAHFLDAAEMLVAMAFAYDWLFDEWTPAERSTLREAMVTRALRRGLEIYETRAGLSSFFVESTANWSSVCNAGLLAGALAIAEDEPELAQRIITHAVASLANPARGYEPDGASEEGPTYWNYGTEFYCLAGLMLDSALGDEAELFSSPAFARTTAYRLHVQSPAGRTFQYADCWPHARASFAYAYLAARFGPAPARVHVRALLPELLTPMPNGESTYRLAPLVALYLPGPEIENSPATFPLDAFFGGHAQLAMMRSSWGDSRASYVGFKAGNALHNHSHLDLGSFLFDHAGVRWSADLGPDSYSLPGYFRSERNQSNPLNEETRHLPNRWTYFRNNNHGHSTLTLGGDLQARGAVAPFVAHASKPELAFAVADLSQVYPLRARTWRRGLALVARKWVLVRDELGELAPGTLVEWCLLTEAMVAVDVDGRAATLSRDGEKLCLIVRTAPGAARLSAAPAAPPSVEENQNEGITRVVMTWTADGGDATIEVHLIPGSDAAPGEVAGFEGERPTTNIERRTPEVSNGAVDDLTSAPGALGKLAEWTT